MRYIPPELIDIIISFCDYEKHHKQNFLPVLEDIKQMGNIFACVTPPHLAYHCWGNGWTYHNYDIDHESMYDN